VEEDARGFRRERMEQRPPLPPRVPQPAHAALVQRDEAQPRAGDRLVDVHPRAHRLVDGNPQAVLQEAAQRVAAERLHRRCNLRRDGNVDHAGKLLVALPRGVLRHERPRAARVRRLVQLLANERIGEVRRRRLLERLVDVRLEQRLVLPRGGGRGLHQPIHRVLHRRGERFTREARLVGRRLEAHEPQAGVDERPRERGRLRLADVLADQIRQQTGEELHDARPADDTDADLSAGQDRRDELLERRSGVLRIALRDRLRELVTRTIERLHRIEGRCRVRGRELLGLRFLLEVLASEQIASEPRIQLAFDRRGIGGGGVHACVGRVAVIGGVRGWCTDCRSRRRRRWRCTRRTLRRRGGDLDAEEALRELARERSQRDGELVDRVAEYALEQGPDQPLQTVEDEQVRLGDCARHLCGHAHRTFHRPLRLLEESSEEALERRRELAVERRDVREQLVELVLRHRHHVAVGELGCHAVDQLLRRAMKRLEVVAHRALHGEAVAFGVADLSGETLLQDGARVVDEILERFAELLVVQLAHQARECFGVRACVRLLARVFRGERAFDRAGPRWGRSDSARARSSTRSPDSRGRGFRAPIPAWAARFRSRSHSDDRSWMRPPCVPRCVG
jgi:hypothetical protein